MDKSSIRPDTRGVYLAPFIYPLVGCVFAAVTLFVAGFVGNDASQPASSTSSDGGVLFLAYFLLLYLAPMFILGCVHFFTLTLWTKTPDDIVRRSTIIGATIGTLSGLVFREAPAFAVIHLAICCVSGWLIGIVMYRGTVKLQRVAKHRDR